MPQFSIVVEVGHVDHLDSAWLALLANGLQPSLPTVPKPRGRNHGPILVSVDAPTAASAEGRVREALRVLDADTFSIEQVAF